MKRRHTRLKTDVKDELIKIRVSRKDKETLKQIASSEGLTLSAYAWQKIMSDDLISRKEIPNLIQAWNILNTLCREIQESGNQHLINFMHSLMGRYRR